MGRARFVASDPQNQTRGKLEDLVPAVAGVTRWNIESNGEVSIEYDDERTSAELIEEAFAGLGYRVRHVMDDPEAGSAARGTQDSWRG